MSKKEPEFGWKTPPPGEQYPTVGAEVSAEEWDEDADILTWFAEKHAPGALKDDRPLSYWIRVLQSWSGVGSVGHNDPSTFEGVVCRSTGRVRASTAILARLAAWSVRALEGSKRDGRCTFTMDIWTTVDGGESDSRLRKRRSFAAGYPQPAVS